MALTESGVAALIDWRLGKIQTEKFLIKWLKKKSKKAAKLDQKEILQLCQEVISSKEQSIKRLQEEIQKMDPRAIIRIKLVKIYMDQLEKTKDMQYFHKVENMNLSPSTLARLLIQRLNGQYANQKMCLITMNALAAQQGKGLWGDNSKKKEDSSVKEDLLASLKKPAEVLLGKEGCALVKECFSQKVLETEIRSFVKNPPRSVAKLCRFIEGVLDSKIQE